MVQIQQPSSQDEQPEQLPPPPPVPMSDPGFGQFMTAQAQMMNAMMLNMNQMMAQQSQTTNALLAMMSQNNQAVVVPPPPPARPQSRLTEFMKTRPATFSSSPEPLDADDWLRSTEKKLDIARCEDREKVLFASHQLEGAAAEWWDTFCASHAGPQSIT